MPENAKPEKTHCPRCHAVFECRSTSILLCQCQSVHLSAEQRAYVSEQFEGCLCAACLQVLRSEYDRQQGSVDSVGRD